MTKPFSAYDQDELRRAMMADLGLRDIPIRPVVPRATHAQTKASRGLSRRNWGMLSLGLVLRAILNDAASTPEVMAQAKLGEKLVMRCVADLIGMKLVEVRSVDGRGKRSLGVTPAGAIWWRDKARAVERLERDWRAA